MSVGLSEQPPVGALQRYIDELLGLDAVAGGAAADSAAESGRAARTGAAGVPRTDGQPIDARQADALPAGTAGDRRLHFLLVSAGGLRVALPAEAVAQVPEVPPGAGCRTVDLGARLRGAAPAATPPGCLLALAACTDTALAVDAVEGPLAVEPEALTQRSSRAHRPWLTGMIDAHRAIVVAVDELIGKENDRGS